MCSLHINSTSKDDYDCSQRNEDTSVHCTTPNEMREREIVHHGFFTSQFNDSFGLSPPGKFTVNDVGVRDPDTMTGVTDTLADASGVIVIEASCERVNPAGSATTTLNCGSVVVLV